MRRLSDVDDDDIKITVNQFAVLADGMFSTAPSTVNVLPPGIYNLQKSFSGQLLWTRHEVTCDELIEIPDAQSDRIFDDMKSFWASKARYDTFGFVHKRAYLLHGPQGTGKTATSNMLANKVVAMGGVVFIPASPEVLTDCLAAYRTMQPDTPVMVMLEELAYFLSSMGQHLMLNLLDGNTSVSGVVMVATTNDIEKLHDNIKNRPGRFDRVVAVDPPTMEVRVRYVERVLARDKSIDDRKRREIVMMIAESTAVAGISLAHTKEIVIANVIMGTPLEEVIKRMSSEAIADEEEDDEDDE